MMQQLSTFSHGSQLSFEVFPPKKWESFPNLYETLDALKELSPSFISCTYGAGGSNSKKTAEIVSYIQNKLKIEGIAHLTCAALTKEDFLSTIRDFQEKGIHNVLALRGDRPVDMPEDVFQNRTYKHPSELIPILKKEGFTVAGACYPEKHYEASSLEEDIHFLKHKVEQGTDFLISQLFFNNDVFYRFLEMCRAAHICVPIEAGIMPITNAKMIGTTIKLSGASIPKTMADLLAHYADSPEDMRKAGIDFAIRQIEDLQAHSVDGIHIYTMNHADVAKDICHAL